MLLNKFYCLCSNEQLILSILGCIKNRTIGDWDIIILIIIFIKMMIIIIVIKGARGPSPLDLGPFCRRRMSSNSRAPDFFELDREETEFVLKGVFAPTEAKGRHQEGVYALLVFTPPPLLYSVVAPDGKL